MKAILFTLCVFAASISYAGNWNLTYSTEIIFSDTLVPNNREPHPIPPPQADHPVRFAEQMPEYPGGEKAMLEFISANVKYPKYELDNNIEGAVYIEFTVEENLSITNVKTVRNVQGAKNFSQEAERVVKLLKFSKPAYQNGKPVRLAMMLPIRFSLNNKVEETPKK